MPERPRDRCTHGARAAAAAVAAAAAAIAIALAGCGGGGGESTTTTSAGAPTASTSRSTTTSTSTTSTGGGSGTGQVGQHLTIPQVVEAVLTTSDPAKACGDDYVTQHYLSVAYGGKQGCVQAQNPHNAAKSIHIQDLQAPDPTFTPLTSKAKVTASGGVYDGEKITVTVVKEAGLWKVDALKSNAPVGP